MSVGLERLWCTCEAIWGGQCGQGSEPSGWHLWPVPPTLDTISAHICVQGHLAGHKGQVAVRHDLGYTGIHEALHVWGNTVLT